jgi:hypothetical protein
MSRTAGDRVPADGFLYSKRIRVGAPWSQTQPQLPGFGGAAHSALQSQRQRDVIQIGASPTPHDLVCLHLHDLREGELRSGIAPIEDAETGGGGTGLARAVVRERFARTNDDRLNEPDRALNRAGWTLRSTRASRWRCNGSSRSGVAGGGDEDGFLDTFREAWAAGDSQALLTRPSPAGEGGSPPVLEVS